MSERIESLSRSVERDEQKVQKLQENIRKRKDKIRELENEEILSNLNSLSAQGVPVQKIIAAIRTKDSDSLLRLVGDPTVREENGTGSVSQIKKEDSDHE